MIVYHEICTGCGICIEACPQGVIFLHDDQAVICDFCQGAPKCIAWCPKGVISFKGKGGPI
jgi:Fe-S-cluster-containing hydrogenase component 2